MNRRDLLQSWAALWALQGCRPLELIFPSGEESGGWYYSCLEIDPTTPGSPQTFAVAASLNSETKIFHLKNSIHSVVYDPQTKLKVFLPKAGASAYFQSGDEKPKEFSPGEGNYFYGHGTFDSKRKVFYSTQSLKTLDGPNEERKRNKGFIYVHSLDDFRIIDQFPTFGNDPHDLKIVGDELVVCNGGEGSNVCFIDPVTRKFKQSFPINDDLLSFGHIEMIDEKNFVLATGAYWSNHAPPLFHLNRDKGLTKFPIPQGLDQLFRVQLLSVVHYDNFVLATCPKTDSLLIWKRTGEFVGAHQIVDATSLAVSRDLGGVIVGTGMNSQPLRLVTFSNNQVNVKALDWGLRSTGSHSIVI